MTVDGFERTFAINHLAHFLLTNLLLDPPRVVIDTNVLGYAVGAGSAFDLGAPLSEREPPGVCESVLRRRDRCRRRNAMFRSRLTRSSRGAVALLWILCSRVVVGCDGAGSGSDAGPDSRGDLADAPTDAGGLIEEPGIAR